MDTLHRIIKNSLEIEPNKTKLLDLPNTDIVDNEYDINISQEEWEKKCNHILILQKSYNDINIYYDIPYGDYILTGDSQIIIGFTQHNVFDSRRSIEECEFIHDDKTYVFNVHYGLMEVRISIQGE